MNDCWIIIGNAGSFLAGIGAILAFISFMIVHKKDKIEKKIQQAKGVSCWISCAGEIIVRNSSDAPIYDVIVSIDEADGGGIRTGNDNCGYSQIIPPGDGVIDAPFNGGYMHHQFGASITFTDCQGSHWTRNALGRLVQDNQEPSVIRKIIKPF